MPPGPHKATMAKVSAEGSGPPGAPKPSLVGAHVPSQSQLGAWGSQGGLCLHNPFFMAGFVPGSRICPWLALQLHTVMGTWGISKGLILITIGFGG